MAINNSLLAELKHEAGNTRKVLERVPLDRTGWKPHDKSTALDSLAYHVAEIPAWTDRIMNNDEFDVVKGPFNRAPKPENTEDLVKLQQQRIDEAARILEGSSDEELSKPWTLRSGDHVIMTLPRVVALRNMVFNHLIHHRAQLTVYLRLLDVPVPGLYGPSADETR